MRFLSDDIPVAQVAGWYPIVRWTDREGARWEYRQGDVREVAASGPWQP